MGVRGLPLRFKSNFVMPARSGGAPLDPKTKSELSTDSRAQIRQHPHTAQPLSPSPHPHSLQRYKTKLLHSNCKL